MRVDDFHRLWAEGDGEAIFAELIFCLLTPQSKAQACWKAVENLRKENLLFTGNNEQITRQLYGVRFKYKKAIFVRAAQDHFIRDGKPFITYQIRQYHDIYVAREQLVKTVKGFGYKEASHFLRNIGLGDNLAILDRHILKNLVSCGVIDQIPNNLSNMKYKTIENQMKTFSDQLLIPLSHLDILMWYKETGEIFK